VIKYFANGQNLPKFIFFENIESRIVKQFLKIPPPIEAREMAFGRRDSFYKSFQLGYNIASREG
jgi:hypothetical protein